MTPQQAIERNMRRVATEKARVNDLNVQQAVERNRRRAATENARVDGLALLQARDRKRKRHMQNNDGWLISHKWKWRENSGDSVKYVELGRIV